MLTLKDRVSNSVIRECCGVKENIVMRIRWFGHVEDEQMKIDETGT